MDSLPLETLQRIFELACTDGGFTGNALSATSRNVRAAARRSRFHTLRIAADRVEFEDFVAFFKRECDNGDDDRPRVRHLFLQLITRSVYESMARVQAAMQIRHAQETYCVDGGQDAIVESEITPLTLRKRSPFTRILTAGARLVKRFTARLSGNGTLRHRSNSEGTLTSQARPLSIDIEEPIYEPYVSPPSPFSERAVQELLRLNAPDLWSLVLYPGHEGIPRHLVSPILEGPFPLLREAAFLGLPGPSHLILSDSLTPSPIFPAATHLHLVPDSAHVEIGLWSLLAPHVTHLQVSQIWDMLTVEQLAEAVGVRAATSVPVGFSLTVGPGAPQASPLPPWGPRTYPSVRYLIMEPVPSPERSYGFGGSAIAVREHAELLHGLESIVLRCREKPEDRVTVTVLPEPLPGNPANAGDTPLRAVREWVESVGGGDGLKLWEEPGGTEGIVDRDGEFLLRG